ncbi:hypothetical protein BDR07DRAFT_1389973 [Suillus spraguei]|nr:hypothetical protein BDR07DRAFT_1389973 [Suillus spraguei]
MFPILLMCTAHMYYTCRCLPRAYACLCVFFGLVTRTCAFPPIQPCLHLYLHLPPLSYTRLYLLQRATHSFRSYLQLLVANLQVDLYLLASSQ